MRVFAVLETVLSEQPCGIAEGLTSRTYHPSERGGLPHSVRVSPFLSHFNLKL